MPRGPWQRGPGAYMRQVGAIEEDLRLARAWSTSDPVERIDTHVSWVFRAGDRVLKVKRPVSLGFLDFSTLEARRVACEAEVRLNARLAPDVYHGVRTIVRQADGSHTFGPMLDVGSPVPADVVDFAVEMTRLDESVRMDSLIAARTLEASDVERVAEHVAAFHARCRADEETARFGMPDAVARNVKENFAQTRADLTTYISEPDAAELERRQLGFLTEHGALLEERARAGRVRDGHGDLRLEHVYLLADRNITVLDCIEFSERFRFADVCADVAFLSMDLAWHERVDLAERLLARYAREASDYDLYAVVDFYEAYRAFVRGKIAALLAGDELASPEARGRGAAEARRYFLLALSGARPPLVPASVVVVSGLVAAGKSTVADRVGLELGAPVVDADRTRKQMLGVEPTHTLRDGTWSGAYDRGFTDRVYAEMFRRAAVVLESGRPVVLDASFRSRALRAGAHALATRFGVPFRLVECRAPDELLRARLAERSRGPSVSDARADLFDAFKASWEAIDELRAAEHVVVDTSRDIDATMHVLRRRLDTWPAGLVA